VSGNDAQALGFSVGFVVVGIGTQRAQSRLSAKRAIPDDRILSASS
jgi:hypothetical protein